LDRSNHNCHRGTFRIIAVIVDEVTTPRNDGARTTDERSNVGEKNGNANAIDWKARAGYVPLPLPFIPGGYADYVILKESNAALKSKSLDHVHAAALPVVGLMEGLIRQSRPK